MSKKEDGLTITNTRIGYDGDNSMKKKKKKLFSFFQERLSKKVPDKVKKSYSNLDADSVTPIISKFAGVIRLEVVKVIIWWMYNYGMIGGVYSCFFVWIFFFFVFWSGVIWLGVFAVIVCCFGLLLVVCDVLWLFCGLDYVWRVIVVVWFVLFLGLLCDYWILFIYS